MNRLASFEALDVLMFVEERIFCSKFHLELFFCLDLYMHSLCKTTNYFCRLFFGHLFFIEQIRYYIRCFFAFRVRLWSHRFLHELRHLRIDKIRDDLLLSNEHFLFLNLGYSSCKILQNTCFIWGVLSSALIGLARVWVVVLLAIRKCFVLEARWRLLIAISLTATLTAILIT